MSPDNGSLPGRDYLAQWSISRGNLRRFIEETALPPIDDHHQRAAGEAAAEAAIQETFGIGIEQFATGVDSVSGAAANAGGMRVTQPDPDIPQHATAAAFFDVDNTLIQGSSLILLGVELFRRKFLTLGEIFPYIVAQVQYRVFGSELPDAMGSGREMALDFVKGQEVDALKEICSDIVDDRLIDRTYAGTRELAGMHIAAGEQVWLVSATPVQIGQFLAARMGFTGALGTVAEEEDGKFTGRLVGDILHGPGKAHAVAALAAIQGLDLSECTAYSDSANDIPMLSMVGTPVAINPDSKLRKHAEEHGWLIRDYRPVRRLLFSWILPAGIAAGTTGALLWRRRKRRSTS